MLHLEQRPAAPPDAHNLQPARIGAEQRAELLVRAVTEAAHQDVRYALALEVRTVLRRRRTDSSATGIPRHVICGTAAARAPPGGRLANQSQYRSHGAARG